MRNNDDLKQANKIIEEQNLTIKDLQNKLNAYSTIVNNFINEINNISQKDVKLNNLKSQLNNNNSNNVNLDDIVCVNFISSDKKVHYAISCMKTNTFAEIEEKLYKQYPQYRETNNTFMANGKQVIRFKTIEENNIGNGLPVTLIVSS